MEILDTNVVPPTLPHWTADGGTTYLPTGVTLDSAPSRRLRLILRPRSARRRRATTDAGVAIGNTACIMFNSRGIPIETNLIADRQDALYVTDGTACTASQSSRPVWCGIVAHAASGDAGVGALIEDRKSLNAARRSSRR